MLSQNSEVASHDRILKNPMIFSYRDNDLEVIFQDLKIIVSPDCDLEMCLNLKFCRKSPV